MLANITYLARQLHANNCETLRNLGLHAGFEISRNYSQCFAIIPNFSQLFAIIRMFPSRITRMRCIFPIPTTI